VTEQILARPRLAHIYVLRRWFSDRALVTAATVLWLLLLNVVFHLCAGNLQILWAHDVVPAVNGFGLVTGNGHGYFARESSTLHVSHCRPPEIWKSSPGRPARVDASFQPLMCEPIGRPT
jgi:hypothetical protein